MQRVLAIYIPFLSTDRLRTQDEPNAGRASRVSGRTEGRRSDQERHKRSPSPHPVNGGSVASPLVPVATVAPHGQTLRLVHVNEAAQQAYVRPGQTLAEAKAVVPELVTFVDDAAADRRQLENLAVWAQRFSPTVHIEGEDTLLVDVTGCERLFGGEANQLRQALDGLAAQGFAARVAIADTPGAAWAIAHAHAESSVVAEPGMSVAYIAALPVWSLRIDRKTTDALFSVGVETIESLLHLPRSSLTSRFGEDLLDRLDQALGDLPELLSPYEPKPVMTSRLEFGGTTDRMEVLLEAVRQATSRLCEQLNRETAGVRRFFVTFDCPHVPGADGLQTRRATLEVSLSHATRSAGHLLSLLKVKLEGLRLPAPAEAVTVWARQVETLDDAQIELFETGSRDAKDLGDLLDRLIVRLGHEAVARPKLVSDYQPEYAFRYVPVIDFEKTEATKNPSRERLPLTRSPGGSPHSGAASAALRRVKGKGAVASIFDWDFGFHAVRPLRLLRRPMAIAATSIVPDGPPIAFNLCGERHEVGDCVGPERIETGWWRGAHIRRDYFRVSTKAGRRCWMFRARDTGHWFLHGWFD